MTATTELGVAVMTVLSIAAALTCRLDRLATARFLPPIFGLMLVLNDVRYEDGGVVRGDDVLVA